VEQVSKPNSLYAGQNLNGPAPDHLQSDEHRTDQRHTRHDAQHPVNSTCIGHIDTRD
jgi:hypothetical protein